MTRLREEVGFALQLDLATGIARTVEWWRGRDDTLMSALSVVHLVRAANGHRALHRVPRVLPARPGGRRARAGAPLQGFRRAWSADPYLALAKGTGARAVFVSDRGFDLTAYRSAAEELGSARTAS